MAFANLADLDLSGKRVFCRVDFNVPCENGVITDDERIRAALPTIKLILQKGGRLVLAAHFGRPKDKRDPVYSLAPVAVRLHELLGQPVAFLTDCVGPQVEQFVNGLGKGQCVLLENVRFYKGEQAKPDSAEFKAFTAQLAKLTDVFVGDAFGAAHRGHASVAGVPGVVAVKAPGLLIPREVEFLEKAIRAPRQGKTVIMGGLKVKDKIKVIDAMIDSCDTLIIGGAMAYTFLKSQGRKIGKSFLDTEMVDQVGGYLEKAKKQGVKVLLPVDTVIAPKMTADAPTRVVEGDIPDDQEGFDIGPKTRKLFADAVSQAKTVIWNGPMGVFEIDQFAAGTLAVAQAVAANKGLTVVGGGDSVAAVHKAGVAGQISHISTGGGASLEMLEGRKLPGIEALRR